MDLLRQTPREQRLFSPVKLDGGELRGVEVRREWKNIDLLITGEDPAFAIATENKIDSGEHSDQLGRYRKIIEGDPKLSAPERRRQYVFLTPEGDAPSEEDWTVYSYADLHRVLTRVRDANESVIGGDVRIFLDHYLRLLRTRLMNDETLETLCRDIYKNHRQAIDLIVEHGRVTAPGMEEVVAWIEEQPGWKVPRKGSSWIHVEPASWSEPGAPRRIEPDGRNAPWLWLQLEWYREQFYFFGTVGSCNDEAGRQKVIDGLKANGDAFGFKKKARVYERSCRLFPQHHLVQSEDGTEADPDEILAAVQKLLTGKLAPLHDLPELLKKLTATPA